MPDGASEGASDGIVVGGRLGTVVGVLLGASEGQGGKVDGAQVGKGIVGITVGGDVGVVDGGTVCAIVLGAMEGDSLDGIGVGSCGCAEGGAFEDIR